MTIKDVLKITATYLGRERVLTALDQMQNNGEETDGLSVINDLTRLANLVINELSLSYIPMEKTEKVTAKDNKIYYSTLTETAIKILDVSDLSGREINAYHHHEYLEVVESEVFVRYTYIPTNYGLTDVVGYSEKEVPARVIAYGVTAEYCLIIHAFDESVMWHKRYMDAISDILTPKNTKVKKRAWL